MTRKGPSNIESAKRSGRCKSCIEWQSSVGNAILTDIFCCAHHFTDADHLQRFLFDFYRRHHQRITLSFLAQIIQYPSCLSPVMGPPLPVHLAEIKTPKLEYVALTQAYNEHLPAVHQSSICLQAIMERPIDEIQIPFKPAVPWKLPKPQQVLDEPVQISHRTGLRDQTMGQPPNPHNKPYRINVYKDGVTEHIGRSREQLVHSRRHAQLPRSPRPVYIRPDTLLSTSVLQPRDINQSLNARPDRRSSDLVSSLHLSKLAPSVTFRNEPKEPGSTPDFSVQFSTPFLHNELKRKMPSPYERSPDCKPVNKHQKIVIDLTSPELPVRQAQPGKQ